MPRIFTTLALILILGGCATDGKVTGSTGTTVDLKGNNYQLIKSGARGEDYGVSFLGFIPIIVPSYANAQANLYASVGESLTGRSIALANQTEDRPFIYAILFGVSRIILTADVIEFTNRPASEERK